jgi:hypothetical protein
MPKLGLGLSLPQTKKVGGAPAPSGIVAATAGNLIIAYGYFSDAQYEKINDTFWQYPFGEEGEFQSLSWDFYENNAWALDTNNGQIRATNPSTNPLIIPTTGWVYTVDTGVQPITITAA